VAAAGLTAFTVTGGAGSALALTRHLVTAHRTAARPSATRPAAVATTKATVSPAPSGPERPSAGGAAAVASSGSAGAATASSVATGPYRVVGLGDSVPAGSACGCTSYVSQVAQQQAQAASRTAAVDNLSVGGYTTSDVLNQLQQSAVRQQVADADLVIITIGANDFDSDIVSDADCDPAALACYQPALAQQATQLTQLLGEVNALQAQHGGDVVVTGYWNVFLDGQVGQANGDAYVRNSNALTIADNALIAGTASAQGDTYVDIYTPFKGDGTVDDTALLAADGDHPNAAGHQLIAQTIEAVLA
jgi:lysophospholipase L1-like esterase